MVFQVPSAKASIVAALAMAVAATCTIACANVRHGNTEEISVASNPQGADVTLNNGMTGVTPFTITVPRERNLVFHFSKEGYQSADVFDQTNVESKYIAADWVDDVSSGAARTHEQMTVTANLVPDPSYVRPRYQAAAPEPAQETPSASPTRSTSDAQSEE
jgi:PEGA domain